MNLDALLPSQYECPMRRAERIGTALLVFLFYGSAMFWGAVLYGCAVQKSKAPQIAPQTADALNFATLVSNAQSDYRIFFSTVGDLERQGALSPQQVAHLNQYGAAMRDSLDEAGSLVKTFEATQSADTAAKIQMYLAQAAQAFAVIYSERTNDLAMNTAQKSKAP